ncbi:MAG: hypothetical protein MPN21_06765 [Thermoanaerobaculia bacterium]|nr:hypothetical protein [Thermoanaerobaculia bacterium]
MRTLCFLVALGVGFLLSSCSGCREDDLPPRPVPAQPMVLVDLATGLTPDERKLWRRTSEGSDLVPVSILRALKDVNTGETFDKSLPAYGFLPSPAGPDNPYGLPVGWTTGVPQFSLLKTEFAGVNCAACHTGQIEVEQEDGSRVALRIDGAPNLADIEAFAVAAKDSVIAMLGDPVETLLFVWRLLSLEQPSGATGNSLMAALSTDDETMSTESMRDFLRPYADAVKNDVEEPRDEAARALGRQFAPILRQGERAPVEHLADDVASTLQATETVRSDIQGILEFLARYRALLENRIQLALFAITAIENPETPTPGPGRDDPWGIIRNTVFFSATPLTAPTSIPHLYWADEFVWYHADGNTNSVLQRNVAQALALGAYIDPDTNVSSLHPRAIFALEDLLDKIVAPPWPEDQLGEIDSAKAERGKALFQAQCLHCHHAREGTLFPTDEVATDPTRAENFLRPQDGQDFWVALPEKVVPLMDFAFDAAGVTQEERDSYEVPHPVWRGTGEYQARQLDGIWSTAPYLHNGSVPPSTTCCCLRPKEPTASSSEIVPTIRNGSATSPPLPILSSPTMLRRRVGRTPGTNTEPTCRTRNGGHSSST